MKIDPHYSGNLHPDSRASGLWQFTVYVDIRGVPWKETSNDSWVDDFHAFGCYIFENFRNVAKIIT